MEKEVTNEAKKEVERLVRLGQKLQAVKYLMDTFGTTLAESKTLTDAVEQEIAAETANTIFGAPQTSGASLHGNLRAEVVQLLRNRQKIEAIKLVKQAHNTGLKEAKELVEKIDSETNPNYRSVKARSGCVGGTFKVIAILFGLVGFLLLASAGIVYFVQSETIENSDRLTGVVVDFKSSGSGTAPVISYQHNGQEKLYTSTTFSSPPAYELNEEVPMFVNRDNPDDVIVDTFSDRWFVIVLLGGLGAFFSLFMALFFFVSGKF